MCLSGVAGMAPSQRDKNPEHCKDEVLLCKGRLEGWRRLGKVWLWRIPSRDQWTWSTGTHPCIHTKTNTPAPVECGKWTVYVCIDFFQGNFIEWFIFFISLFFFYSSPCFHFVSIFCMHLRHWAAFLSIQPPCFFFIKFYCFSFLYRKGNKGKIKML